MAQLLDTVLIQLYSVNNLKWNFVRIYHLLSDSSSVTHFIPFLIQQHPIGR
jgi:hypothetical protein